MVKSTTLIPILLAYRLSWASAPSAQSVPSSDQCSCVSRSPYSPYGASSYLARKPRRVAGRSTCRATRRCRVSRSARLRRHFAPKFNRRVWSIANASAQRNANALDRAANVRRARARCRYRRTRDTQCSTGGARSNNSSRRAKTDT